MKKEHIYGAGTVYQTSEGRWVVKISLGTGPDGKPLTKRFSAKTKAAVEKKLRDFKKAQRQEAKPSTIHYTLAAYLDFWMRTYQYQKLKPLSYDRLESTIRNHILPHLGKMRFDQVSRDDIQRLINYLYRQKKLSYSSVKKTYLALSACYAAFMDGRMNVSELARVCGLSRPTVYKYWKMMR